MPDFDVVDLGPTDHLEPGETAPDFTRPLVTAETWEDRSLSDVAGDGPTLLLFTTMVGAFLAEYTLSELRERGIGIGERAERSDVNGGAGDRDESDEAADSRDETDESAGETDESAGETAESDDHATESAAESGLEDVTVVTVSISSPYETIRFLAEDDSPYGIFSDPSNAVAEAYGVVHDLDGMAGISEPRPAAFVLDADRTIRYAWAATEWPDRPDFDEVVRALETE